MPKLIFLAGPNGSGKSTIAAQDQMRRLHQTPDEQAGIVKINPDDVLRELSLLSLGDDLEARAAFEADKRLAEAVTARRSVLRETVLSTLRLLPIVEEAKSAGFEFALIFVFLRDPGMNVKRVAARVRQGGHDVPADKIMARWERALRLLPEYAARANTFLLYDNSAFADPLRDQAGPVLMIEATPTSLYISPEAQVIAEGRSQVPPVLRETMAGLIGRLTP